MGHCLFFFLYHNFKKPKHYKSVGVTGSQEKWVESLKHVARYAKLENGRLTVKFDEIGVISFGQKIPGTLGTAGFHNFALDILVTFCSGLTEVFENLLRPQPTLTGKDFEILARILLGFQAVVIFGVKAITPSIKQVSVCTVNGWGIHVGSITDCLKKTKVF